MTGMGQMNRRSMKTKHSIILSLAAFILLPVAMQSQTQDRTAVAGFSNRDGSGSLSTAAAEDLGQLQETGLYQPTFGLNASSQFTTVTNALQQGKNSSADFLFMPAVNATLFQPLPYGFNLDALLQLNSVIYTRFSNLNFWGPSGEAHANWQYAPWAPKLFFGTEPYYFQSFTGNANVTSAATITTGILQNYSLGKDGRTQLTLGYKFSDFYANPSFDNRYLNTASVTITRNLAAGVSAGLFYAYQYSYYRNAVQVVDPNNVFNLLSTHRQDSQNIIGLNLTKHFNRHFTGTVSGSWVGDNSTLSGYSYQNFIVSVGLNWQFF